MLILTATSKWCVSYIDYFVSQFLSHVIRHSLVFQLQSKLVTTERELESLKITCKLRDAEAETLATSKAAGELMEMRQ